MEQGAGRSHLAGLNYTGNLNDSDGKRGYAGTALLVPADDLFAQSAADQMVYRYVPVALRQHAKGWSSRLGGTLNHDFDSDWHLSVVGYWSRSGSRTVTDAGVDQSTAQALLDAGDPDFDPYGFLTGAMFRATRRTSPPARRCQEPAGVAAWHVAGVAGR
jgi:hypothetical protein